MTEYIYIYIIKSTNFVKIKQNLTSFNSKEEIKMRVTIDLDRDIIIIPDNFFKKIGEENEKLEKYGATAVDPLVRIWHSFFTAMDDTNNRLLTQTNAKTSTRKKKTVNVEETKKRIDKEKEIIAEKKAEAEKAAADKK